MDIGLPKMENNPELVISDTQVHVINVYKMIIDKLSKTISRIFPPLCKDESRKWNPRPSKEPKAEKLE